jgi:hypothetical protein
VGYRLGGKVKIKGVYERVRACERGFTCKPPEVGVRSCGIRWDKVRSCGIRWDKVRSCGIRWDKVG